MANDPIPTGDPLDDPEYPWDEVLEELDDMLDDVDLVNAPA